MSHTETLDPPRPVPSRAEILAVIEEIAHDRVGWTGIASPELRLVEDLALDSIRLLTLAIEVEDRFRVCLDEEDEAEIRTLGDLADTVARKLEEGENGNGIVGQESVGGRHGTS
jgi:acyl carrier protein